MKEFFQGDIIKISGYKNPFMIVSNNTFIRSTGMFHVCPLLNVGEGPLHIYLKGKNETGGTVCCEQIKLTDPAVRACTKIDRISYEQIMNVSDALQGIFEYD